MSVGSSFWITRLETLSVREAPIAAATATAPDKPASKHIATSARQ